MFSKSIINQNTIANLWRNYMPKIIQNQRYNFSGQAEAQNLDDNSEKL